MAFDRWEDRWNRVNRELQVLLDDDSIEITPAMLAAGAEVASDQHYQDPEPIGKRDFEERAIIIYRAMVRARSQ